MLKTATLSDFEAYNFTTQSSFYVKIYTKPEKNYLDTLLFGVDEHGPEAAIRISIQKIGWTTILRRKKWGLTRRGGKKVWSFLRFLPFVIFGSIVVTIFLLTYVTREDNRLLGRG